MDTQSMILGISFLTDVIVVVGLFIVTKRIADLRESPREEVPEEHENIRDQLTAYELERLEREESFDARIAQIKDELAKQQHVLRSSGISADELHPLVKNLPHNIIAEKHSGLPDVEYAE